MIPNMREFDEAFDRLCTVTDITNEKINAFIDELQKIFTTYKDTDYNNNQTLFKK